MNPPRRAILTRRVQTVFGNRFEFPSVASLVVLLVNGLAFPCGACA